MTQRKSSTDHTHARAIGRRIRKLRGETSQAVFASHFGLSRAALANYELGRTKPPQDVIDKISKFAGADIGEGPDLADLENEVHAIAGRIEGISDDEMAFLRLLRVSHPPVVQSVVRTLIDGFKASRVGLSLYDPNSAVVDLARMIEIAEGRRTFDLGLTTDMVVRLAYALAERGLEIAPPQGD